MLETLSSPKNPGSLAASMREIRMGMFKYLISRLSWRDKRLRILDMGGTPQFWLRFAPGLIEAHDITIANLEKYDSTHGITCIEGNACNLSAFPARSFDVVFSNSVIEHVGDWYHQLEMAAEVQRLAANYFVQTPNYGFPMEPHMLIPGFQWMPYALRVAVLRYTPLGKHKWCSAQVARHHATRIWLLTRRDLRCLFPHAAIVPERWHGLVKSWIVHHGFERPFNL